MKAMRNHPAFRAFVVHRISGVALALFLPAHFLVLGLALQGEARMEEFLRWSEQPLVIAGEWVLVMLLAAHLAGGLRVLALELLTWRNWQKTLAALAGGFAIASGLLFLLAR
jgi:fumarate reductase subunit D